MQKKIIQQQLPQVRKVFTTTTAQQHHSQQPQHQQQQLNAVKKINSLLQSGSVSVTGIPSGQQQQRIIHKKPLTPVTVSSASNNSFAGRPPHKCYICGENAGANATLISEASTTTTQTEYVVKLAKVIGSDYSVVLTVEDVICRRCIMLLNQYDKLESELDTLRGTLLGFIHKKNNIPDDADASGMLGSPPSKMPKLTPISSAGSGGTVSTPIGNVMYKVASGGQQQQVGENFLSTSGSDLNTSNTSDVEAQLTSMFEKGSTASPGTSGQQQQQPVKQHIVVTTNNGGMVGAENATGGTTTTTVGGLAANRKGTKMYKCIPCGFKTTDLSQFQPHYATCPPRLAGLAAQNANSPNATANTTTTTTTTTTTGYRCKLCKLVFANVALLKQHSLQEHQQQMQQSQQKTIVTTTTASSAATGGAVTQQDHHHQQGSTGGSTVYSCTVCNTYKTTDKQAYDDHLRKHIKLKPFKCRVCLMRFETREQASIHAKQHQPDYFKCGICNVTFSKREQLMSHLEVHESAKKPVKQPAQQQQQQQQQQQEQLQQQQQQQQQQLATVTDSSTQKLLQASIDEALRGTISESMGDSNVIQFYTCNSCSLTFLSEPLYTQHIKTHTAGTAAAAAPAAIASGVEQQLQAHQGHQSQQLMQLNSGTGGVRKSIATSAAVVNNASSTDGTSRMITTTSGSSSNTTTANSGSNAGSNTITDGDLESIFERMHSESKGSDSRTSTTTTTTTESNNVIITNQDGSTENITFNITLPQQEDGTYEQQQQQQQQEQQQSVGIDMPTLDQGDDQHQKEEQQQQQQHMQSMPVSMPSLDDDGEQSQNSQNSNTENVPMELEDMQGGEGQQINLILNDGQVLQLDNHILTTDAEGNQILVQGTDSEQIQQLLQSVGVVMQGGEGLGEGETLQMISGDGNNQMILVQGADGQEQLIDASLLNADGNIVIQQSQEGELNAEGTHITTEDGLQIPVSVAFTTAGGEAGHEGQLTVSVADGGEQQLQLHLQQAAEGEDGQQQQHHHHHHHHHGGDGGGGDHQQQGAILTESGQIILQAKEHDEEATMKVTGEENGSAIASEDGAAAADGGGQTNGGGAETTNGSNGTTVTTTTTATSGTAGTNVVTSSNAGDDQMFNFDELIQPQIVIKQQQVK